MGRAGIPDRRKTMCRNRSSMMPRGPGRTWKSLLYPECVKGMHLVTTKVNESIEMHRCQILKNFSHQKD